ncbi:50S ribosomal protein L10 [Candidatus Pacearchaeota archaeon]|nr:50S ribosomal protein L10 [Candidatus Pacearchaeota archaeon]
MGVKVKISDKKRTLLKDIVSLINKYKTIMVCSIQNLPSSQFQSIRKTLRDICIIKAFKKNIVVRAIDSIKNDKISKLKDIIEANCVLLFSEKDPFELSAILNDSKTSSFARAGNTAPMDITIEPGPTELVPGPAISEFGALGIKIAVEDGKISIREPKTIAKKGEEINGKAASIMMKLGIKPIFIGLEPLAAYSRKDNVLYKDIKVDRAETLSELREIYSKALAFAVSISYACRETISYLLFKAYRNEMVLQRFLNIEKST